MASKSRYSQSWNNTLNYIKRNLGAPTTLLEMSDEEIVEGLEEDTLSLVSQYSPHIKFTFIDDTNIVPMPGPGHPRWRYKLPVDPGDNIIDIYECMLAKYSSALEEIQAETVDIQSYYGTIDVVISNAFADASRSLGVRNTWEFIPPDDLFFDERVNRCCVMYNVPHDSPKTMRPDVYNNMFKQLALGHIQRWLAAKRAMFENVSTPFGQINLNWNKLEADSQTNIQEATQKLELIPPDKLLEVCI